MLNSRLNVPKGATLLERNILQVIMRFQSKKKLFSLQFDGGVLGELYSFFVERFTFSRIEPFTMIFGCLFSSDAVALHAVLQSSFSRWASHSASTSLHPAGYLPVLPGYESVSKHVQWAHPALL